MSIRENRIPARNASEDERISIDPTTTGRPARATLVAICLLAAALRLPSLGTVPPPLNQDEASRGYDAWCLLETGADRWGARWPLFLKSFGPGDYTAALSTYITVPFVALLGPTPVAFRLPAALLGILTILALWFWMRRTLDDQTATLAALLLAVNPWHITLTRTAHEAAFMPFFLVWALAMLAHSGLPPYADATPVRSRHRIVAAAMAGFMFALAAWDYPAARLIVPLFLAGWIGCNIKRLLTLHRAAFSALVIALVISAAPLWLTALRAPEQLAARASATSLFNLPLPFTGMLRQFALNYAAEFNPAVLFFQGDDISHTATPGFGRLLLVEIPFVLIGLITLLSDAAITSRARLTAHGSRLLLALLLLHPLPAAICRFWSPHALRAFTGVIVWPAVSAMGAMCIWNFIRLRAPAAQAALRSAAAFALTVSLAWFGWCCFIRWPAAAADAYQENLVRAVQIAAPRVKDHEFIYISEFTNQPYIYALLFAPIPPSEWNLTPRTVAPWHENFEHVIRMGKWFFPPIVQGKSDRIGIAAHEQFAQEWSHLPPGARGLIIDLPHHGPPGRLLTALPRRSGDPGLEIREWTKPPHE